MIIQIHASQPEQNAHLGKLISSIDRAQIAEMGFEKTQIPIHLVILSARGSIYSNVKN